jgi:hypothetical protein
VLFLDADDVVEPRLVERSLAALEATPGAEVACSGWNAVDLSGALVAAHAPPVWESELFHQLLKGNPAPPCCWVARRAAQERIGEWSCDPQINGHQDWEWALRAALLGMKFATTTGAIAIYRTYPESMSGDRTRMYLGRMEVFRRYRSAHGRCDACRRAITRATLGSRLRFLYDLASFVGRSRLRGLGRATRDAVRVLRAEPTFPFSLLADGTVVACRRALRPFKSGRTRDAAATRAAP